MSLSCLAEGLDDEAADVENRAEKRENPRREAMVYSSKVRVTLEGGRGKVD